MKSGFTKSQLIALHDLVGLNAAKTTLKPQLIDTLYGHLVNHPSDLQIDPRLGDFYREQENNNEPIKEEEDSETSKSSDGEDEAPRSNQLFSTLSDTSFDHTVELITDKVANAVEDTRAGVTSTIQSTISRFNVDFSQVQRVVSRVWFVNIGLLVVEYAAIVFAFWPRDILGDFRFDQSSLIACTKYVFRHWFTHVAPAFVIASLFNFTNQASLYRRKRVHSVDPVIFGVAHMLIAAVVANIGVLPLVSQLSVVTGLASAVVGVYAAVLRTQ